MILGLFSSLVSPVALALYLGIAVLCLYLTRNNNYWKDRGIPSPPSSRIPFVDLISFIIAKKSVRIYDNANYYQHGGKNLCGFLEFGKPALMVGNIDHLKRILIKDFGHFVDRRPIPILKQDAPELGYMLTLLEGQEWKDVRSVISPTFSAGKMKNMQPLIVDCADNLVLCIDRQIDTKDELEVKEIFGRFTMDTIATTAFGVEGDSLLNPESEFAKMAALFVKSPSPGKMLLFIVAFFFPFLVKILPIKIIAQAPLIFFSSIIRSTIEYRAKNDVRRNDFLQLMMDARAEENAADPSGVTGGTASKKKVITDHLMISNAFLFFIAGFDTTASALSFATYLLALNPDIQEKLVGEIEDVLAKHDGKITYEAIQNMTYLDLVLSETLRMYPLATRLERVATKNYQLPGTDLTIPKGMIVVIPAYSIHHDPEIYPNPEKFDPERFSLENKSSRDPVTYLAFGQGPRNCVGIRFAQIEAKIALAAVVRKFRFSPCTHTDIPIKFDPFSNLLKSLTGIQLKVTRRTASSPTSF